MKIGKTPAVRLKSLRFKGKTIFIKLEYFNEGGNIKMRVAANAVKQAEKKGYLVPFKGNTIIEASGGSMGISLAIIAAKRGYKITLVLPNNYNPDRIRQLPVYGADLVLSDPATGNDSHFRLAEKLAAENNNCYYIDQLNNPANPMAHYQTTGREIVKQVPDIDCFVSVVGSGGTISGVGKRIKEANSNAKIIAVQPEGCNILTGLAIPHKIQGTAVGLIPSVFDRSIVDDVISVTYEEAMEMGRYLVKNEGLFLGISSCANILAAEKVADQMGSNKRIVTIAPDGGQIYLSHYLNTQNK